MFKIKNPARSIYGLQKADCIIYNSNNSYREIIKCN